MPEIRVGLEKYLEGMTTGASVITRIYSLGKPAKTRSPVRTLMIPAGSRTATAAVDLPVGKYLFEAYLPSGDVAAKTSAVRRGANEPVFLRASDDSPHEWLSWQHLAGQPHSWTRSSAGYAAVPVSLDVVTRPGKAADLWSLLLALWKGERAPNPGWTVLNVPPRAGYPGPLVDGRLASYLYSQGPWEEGGRYYCLAQTPGGAPVLSVLPLPWHQADMNGDAEVDVLVNSRQADASNDRNWPVRVSVVVRDRVMSIVFGYLGAGDLPAASRVTETAVDLLYGKMQNPLAAAGGAYILVRSSSQKARPEWEPWLRNLNHLFPWLPDGAVLDGWAHLNGIGRPRDVKQAGASFVDAVNRGLPFYSAGVRLLFEGLTRVAQESKRPDGFAPAFQVVRHLALRVDASQPFTVVRLG